MSSGERLGHVYQSAVDRRTADLAAVERNGAESEMEKDLELAARFGGGDPVIDQDQIAQLVLNHGEIVEKRFRERREKGYANDLSSSTPGIFAIIRRPIDVAEEITDAVFGADPPRPGVAVENAGALGGYQYLVLSFENGAFDARAVGAGAFRHVEAAHSISFFTEVDPGAFGGGPLLPSPWGRDFSLPKSDVVLIAGAAGDLWQNPNQPEMPAFESLGDDFHGSGLSD